ncbi:response regulator [Glaciecola sp. MH2013]|uniref:response regulator n=1 Tax=Glaciecola sp. MH2013 TaxID=2785524 RepID=UPI0018A02A74|nr:response regulator [Glaciecola sp. MH2013]MBF7073422.1 response regulator [Glaciecola sp. MH2013]
MTVLKSILIIDDDEDDCFLIEERIRDVFGDDCEFLTCYHKAEAVELLKERSFYLCILDYRLAGYEGIEVLEEVASAELATPIIMLTGQDDRSIAERAIKNGAQDFVMKSAIDDDVFEKSVQYAVTRKALEFARSLGKKKEAQSVAKDKFIAHLSHELRTPLTSILGYTSLLLDNTEAEKFHKELSIISNNGKHLLNLLNDVLDLSKIAANKFELKEQGIDLEQTLIELQALVSMNAIEKGLSLNFHCLTKLPKRIIIDDMRFRQVLLNLLGNAIKFTDKGKVSACFSYFATPEPRLEIKVKDTGIGMLPDQTKDIFSPFTQVEDVANRKAGGAGLGLSISSEIIKHMKGTLTVESRLGEGSEFTLRVPCRIANNNPENSDSTLLDFNLHQGVSVNNEALAPQLEGKVLIVDDVLEIRQLAGLFLKETGLDLAFASNGADALQKIQDAASTDAASAFDIVLMDLHMPIMTGIEATAQLKEKHPKLMIVAMTAAIEKGMQKSLMDKGFDGLLSKPLNKAIMWELLKDLIAKQRAAASKHTSLVHLVEDDEDNAAIMRMMLEQLECDVVISSHAAAALAVVKERPDITHHLLDLGLPDLSGVNFLNAFFEYPVAGEVSILSGDQPDDRILTTYPISNHFVKPTSKADLAKWLG